MATYMWLISHGNRLASFSATLLSDRPTELATFQAVIDFCCKPVYIPSWNGSLKW